MNPFGLGMLNPSLLTGNRNEFGLGNPYERFPANKKLNPFGFNAFFFMPGSSNERFPIYRDIYIIKKTTSYKVLYPKVLDS